MTTRTNIHRLVVRETPIDYNAALRGELVDFIEKRERSVTESASAHSTSAKRHQRRCCEGGLVHHRVASNEKRNTNSAYLTLVGGRSRARYRLFCWARLRAHGVKAFWFFSWQPQPCLIPQCLDRAKLMIMKTV